MSPNSAPYIITLCIVTQAIMIGFIVRNKRRRLDMNVEANVAQAKKLKRLTIATYIYTPVALAAVWLVIAPSIQHSAN